VLGFGVSFPDPAFALDDEFFGRQLGEPAEVKAVGVILVPVSPISALDSRDHQA